MIQYTSQCIFDSTTALGSNFHGLADSDAKATHVLRVLRQDTPSGISEVSRAGVDGCPVGLHKISSIRLLLITDLDHEDFYLHVEERTCHRQRRSPLPRTRFRRKLLDPFLLIVVDLSYSGIRLVAAYRADALILVVNTGGSIQRLLQPACPVERTGSPL